ncbi:MAG: DVU_1556 family methyltransferase [Desulfobacter sp.]
MKTSSPAALPDACPENLRVNRPGGLALTRKALGICKFNGMDPILDAGCGWGATPRFLREDKGLFALGLDADPNRLDQGMAYGRFPAAAARLEALPFGREQFQGIFCECVLSLVPDKQACLHGFFTILKPGGSLVLTDLILPRVLPRVPPREAVTPRPAAPVTCLDGALTLDALAAAIENAGFRIRVMEDHTRLLKEMACEMVFRHGSLDRFWAQLTGNIMDTGLAGQCRRGVLKPGYCMVIADKPQLP